MKTITITKRIDKNSKQLEMLKGSKMCDLINLKDCYFVCSEGIEILKNRYRSRLILSDEVKELIVKTLN